MDWLIHQAGKTGSGVVEKGKAKGKMKGPAKVQAYADTDGVPPLDPHYVIRGSGSKRKPPSATPKKARKA